MEMSVVVVLSQSQLTSRIKVGLRVIGDATDYELPPPRLWPGQVIVGPHRVLALGY